KSYEENKILFNTNKELEWEQLEQVENLLNENVHNFAQKISKDRQTRPYTLARDEQEFLQKEIFAMKEQGIIFKLKSPWTSPVVLVPKKNRKKQICIDYCKLNTVTEKE
ncbi:22230_t:CDS:2, partial [Gigaspora rosea]